MSSGACGPLEGAGQEVAFGAAQMWSGLRDPGGTRVTSSADAHPACSRHPGPCVRSTARLAQREEGDPGSLVIDSESNRASLGDG